MKLNLGCGEDRKQGYTNVDFRRLPTVDEVVDLSNFPWPWRDQSAEEILMLDFLEHFPYRMTEKILKECWRVLGTGGRLVVQVPDLEHCAMAASLLGPFRCNQCGWMFPANDLRSNFMQCGGCGQSWMTVASEAVRRIFGGQDYEGNFHQTGFSKTYLYKMLQANGFEDIQELESEHQHKNWNFKYSAKKMENLWDD